MLPSLSVNTITSFFNAVSRRYRRILLALTLVFGSPALLADWALNMREGITEISRETYSLHMTIIWICVAIGVVVYGVLVYSLFAYRKSKGAEIGRAHV